MFSWQWLEKTFSCFISESKVMRILYLFRLKWRNKEKNWRCNILKNVSSSTTHKKTLKLWNCQTLKLWNYGILASANPSPNDFPTLCKQFSARFPLKGSAMVPSFALWLNFWIISIPLIPPFLCVMIYTSW